MSLKIEFIISTCLKRFKYSVVALIDKKGSVELCLVSVVFIGRLNVR